MPGDSKFITIALPEEIIKKIDDCVASSNHKYVSRPHVIKLALVKFFEDNGGGMSGDKVRPV